MSVEKLNEQLAAVETSEDMSLEALGEASKEMNRIICEALVKARGENNTNQFASLLAEYRKIWYNKPGLNLRRVNLLGANLSGANLSGANLSGANLSGADLSGADLRDANLSGADLFNVNLRDTDLFNANLSGVNLSGINLRDANLSRADLRDANLSGADLHGANLFGANLFNANLRNADLRNASLSGANLGDANLSGAILKDTDLSKADLSYANLRGAITIGANFAEVKDDFDFMTKEELQAKLANAIKTPDALLKAIQHFLDDSNKTSITKEELDTLPSLYKAALDIGNNGAKNREDKSVICQPSEAICQELLSSARLLKETFPVLAATPFSGLHDKVADVSEERGGEVNNSMAVVTSLRGIYANQKDSSEKLNEQLAAVKTSEDMSSKKLGEASKKSNSMASVAFLRGIYSNLRGIYANQKDSSEKLNEQLAAVKTSEGMSDKKLDEASKKMNRILCEALVKARGEGNTNQFASLLAEYRKIWYNKPGLNLRGVNLLGAKLCDANLHDADLSNVNLLGANLSAVNLSNANLFGAILLGAILFGANLRDADLRDVNLSRADLRDANLSRADLRDANLSRADLGGANLSGAITIGADFTEVKNDVEPMTEKELQRKLANAIKTPDALLNAIQRFLDDSNKISIIKEDLDTLPSLYRAALDIGNNGAKNRKDGSVICQPGDAICQELLSSARLLNKTFPVLTATPFSGLHDKMVDALAGRGGEISNFMAAVTFLRGVVANQKDSSLSGLTPEIGVKIVSALLSNDKEADEYLATKMAYQLCAQADTKEFSAKEVIKLKNVLSPDEKALPSVNAILALEVRIIEAVSAAKDGKVVIINTTVDGKIYSDDTVKDALKEASGKQILPDTVELTRKYKTSKKSEKIHHDNQIQITMPKDMVAAIRPSKKKEEKIPSPPALKIQMVDERPVPGGAVVGQGRV